MTKILVLEAQVRLEAVVYDLSAGHRRPAGTRKTEETKVLLLREAAAMPSPTTFLHAALEELLNLATQDTYHHLAGIAGEAAATTRTEVQPDGTDN